MPLFVGGGGLLILEDFFSIASSRTDTGACSVIRTTTVFYRLVAELSKKGTGGTEC